MITLGAEHLLYIVLDHHCTKGSVLGKSFAAIAATDLQVLLSVALLRGAELALMLCSCALLGRS